MTDRLPPRTPADELAEALEAIHVAVAEYAALEAAQTGGPQGGLVIEWVLAYAEHLDLGNGSSATGTNLVAYPTEAATHRIAGLIRWATLRLDRLLGNGA